MVKRVERDQGCINMIGADGIIDTDAAVVSLVVGRASKFLATGETASIMKAGDFACSSVESANAFVAGVARASDLTEVLAPAGESYGVFVNKEKTQVMLLTKALERAFIRRAHAASGARGAVPWQTFAVDAKPAYLGEHFAMSSALRATVQSKGNSNSKPAEKKAAKRKRTPSPPPVVASESEGEESDESIGLSEDESADDEELMDEDGGVRYSFSVEGKTPRAFKLGLARAYRAWCQ